MNIAELAEQLGIDNGADINAIRNAVVTREFAENQETRVFILIAQFPFLVIGSIDEVVSDYVIVDAEVTNVSELDGEKYRIHIDDIEVFYIEKEGKPPIPDLRAVQND